jgi:hypothetical protein
MFQYIARTPSIREVILSGGDPLTLGDGTIDWLLGNLRAIPHVEVLRIGSRMPVVLPMRITPDLCGILKRHRPLWFNTQFNAPGELTPERPLHAKGSSWQEFPSPARPCSCEGQRQRGDLETLYNVFSVWGSVPIICFNVTRCGEPTFSG